MGTQVPLLQRGTALRFSVHICCGQIARSIKMPLGRKVGIDPSNIVLDGDPALPSSIFGPCLLCPNGCMNQDATWHGGLRILYRTLRRYIHAVLLLLLLLGLGPRPRPHCARWGPSSPAQKGAQPPLFDPCLLWPNGRPSQLLLSTCTNGRPKTAENNKWCDAT